MQEGRIRVPVAESNVLHIGVVLREVVGVEHVSTDSAVPLRLQRGVVVHRHPDPVLDGGERVVCLREGEVVVAPQAVLRHAVADHPIAAVQRVEPAFILPAVRKSVSVLVSVRVQPLRFFGPEASGEHAADQK